MRTSDGAPARVTPPALTVRLCEEASVHGSPTAPRGSRLRRNRSRTARLAEAPEVYAYRVDVTNAPGARAIVEGWRLTA
nr:hypothetical protein [Streptomyces sp. XY006]